MDMAGLLEFVLDMVVPKPPPASPKRKIKVLALVGKLLKDKLWDALLGFLDPSVSEALECTVADAKTQPSELYLLGKFDICIYFDYNQNRWTTEIGEPRLQVVKTTCRWFIAVLTETKPLKMFSSQPLEKDEWTEFVYQLEMKAFKLNSNDTEYKLELIDTEWNRGRIKEIQDVIMELADKMDKEDNGNN